MDQPSRDTLIQETIQAFVELVLAEQFTGLPDWVTTDLSVSQMKALFRLGQYHTLTVSKLANLLGMGNSAASILVQRLVERQMVERSEDAVDRRRTYVRLTEKGVGLLSGRQKQREALLGRWLNQLEDDDIASLLKGLHALAKIVRAEGARAHLFTTE